jgi:hypothetical protein
MLMANKFDFLYEGVKEVKFSLSSRERIVGSRDTNPDH